MKESNARTLLEKYAAGKCTPEEMVMIESWYLQKKDEAGIGLSEDERLTDMAAVRESLLREIKPTRKRVFNLWLRTAAAASVIITLSIGYLYVKRRPQAQNENIVKNDIAPGGYKAILTLSNGKQIDISNATKGQLALQGTNLISKTADGQITYRDKAPANDPATGATGYNTLKTPPGGQYQVLLSDGTRVLLNAKSSLTYPAKFSGGERLVNLSGEAYFEVKHNSKQPFRVMARGQLIEDIGTQFNVNSYQDEPVAKTTLVEGSIKVIANRQSKILIPGQQAIFKGDQLLLAKDVDLDEAISWKEGYFNFNTETLETAMNNISRWYDVEIEYKNNALRTMPLGGTISKYKSVSQVLKKMELTGAIHFKLIGRKIIVE